MLHCTDTATIDSKLPSQSNAKQEGRNFVEEASLTISAKALALDDLAPSKCVKHHSLSSRENCKNETRNNELSKIAIPNTTFVKTGLQT